MPAKILTPTLPAALKKGDYFFAARPSAPTHVLYCVALSDKSARVINGQFTVHIEGDALRIPYIPRGEKSIIVHRGAPAIDKLADYNAAIEWYLKKAGLTNA